VLSAKALFLEVDMPRHVARLVAGILLVGGIFVSPIEISISDQPIRRIETAFAAGGPVILDGTDAGYHGQVSGGVVSGQWVYVLKAYSNLISGINSTYKNTTSNGRIAVVGSPSETRDGISNNCGGAAYWASRGATGGPYTIDWYDGATNISNFFDRVLAGTEKPMMIHIVDTICSTNKLDSSENTEVGTNGNAIATHVNRGGALFANTHNYLWLSALFPTLSRNSDSGSTLQLTTDGQTAFPGLTNSDIVGAWHNGFVDSSGTIPLTVLAKEGTKIGIIGGASVTLPSAVTNTPTPSSNTIGNQVCLVVNVKRGNPLANFSGATVAFSVAGANAGLAIPSQTTGADGNTPSVCYTGSSTGTDSVTATATDATYGALGEGIATVTWTAPPVTATSAAATSVTATSAVLNGTIGAGVVSTTPSFVWGTDPTLVSGATSVSGGSAQTGTFAATATLTGLPVGTRHYFKAIATPSAGSVASGSILSFDTLSEVVNGISSSITRTGAQIAATFTTGDVAVTPSFEYGTSATLASGTTVVSAGSPQTGAFVATANISGLAAGTTYYYRAISTPSNSADRVTSSISSFTTAPPATTTTTSSTTTTSTTTTTTTTVPSSSTSLVSAPVEARIVVETTVPIGQSSIATIPQSVKKSPTRSTSGLSSLGDLVATVTTTTTIATSTTTTVPAPVVPAAEPGMAVIQVEGGTGTANISRADDRLVIESPAVRAVFEAVSSDGGTQPLDADGNIRVRRNGLIQYRAEGFKPGATAEVWLLSTPTLLARVDVPQDGALAGKHLLPKGIPDGQHRIVLRGTSADNTPLTLTVGILIDQDVQQQNVRRILIGVPLGLAVLFGLVIPPLKRRKREMDDYSIAD